MPPQPPSIPPVRAVPRPDLGEPTGASPPSREPARVRTAGPPSREPARLRTAGSHTGHPPRGAVTSYPRRRTGSRRSSMVGGGIAVIAILVAFHFSGLAPWARAIPEATALDAKLERAFERAAAAAADDGVQLEITSGLRSAAEQQALWNEAVDEYGGPHEAARWVLPPELSAHVQGRAVDVGPAEGAQWLGKHGERWGLCQVFANEPWHFERLTSKNGTCPEQLPDASALLDLE